MKSILSNIIKSSLFLVVHNVLGWGIGFLVGEGFSFLISLIFIFGGVFYFYKSFSGIYRYYNKEKFDTLDQRVEFGFIEKILFFFNFFFLLSGLYIFFILHLHRYFF
jgi:hypothetical protein